jgi:hypothetical protein
LIIFNALAGLTNNLLIEVESLADLDPAIFTEVRNYYYEDVAIRMPDDQRYTEEDDDDKERKKRQKEVIQ